MRTIYADFNAMTAGDCVRLTTRGSEEDRRRLGVGIGEWIWLSDGELIVGARIEDELHEGVVGRPDWDTLVRLDDEGARDTHHLRGKIDHLLSVLRRSVSEDAQLYTMLTQLEFAMPQIPDDRPGYRAARRGAALLEMGKPELALVETEFARSRQPGYPLADLLHLEALRRVSPERAVANARRMIEDEGVSATVLAAAINIISQSLEGVRDELVITDVNKELLEFCDRFDKAPGREDIQASTLSLVHFNRGMALLQMGRLSEARAALSLAHAIEPLDDAIPQAIRLTERDPQIHELRELAARVRAKPRSAA